MKEKVEEKVNYANSDFDIDEESLKEMPLQERQKEEVKEEIKNNFLNTNKNEIIKNNTTVNC